MYRAAASAISRSSSALREQLARGGGGELQQLWARGYASKEGSFGVGVVEAKYYQYTGRKGDCRRLTAPGVTIDEYNVIEGGSEWDLKCALARQPVVVYMKTDPNFHEYTEGILDGPSYYGGNHYLTMVTYDSEDGQDYWMAKNSWDTAWGESGYVRFARGVNHGYGPFGITQLIAYPVKWPRKGQCYVKSDEDMFLRPFRRTESRTW